MTIGINLIDARIARLEKEIETAKTVLRDDQIRLQTWRAARDLLGVNRAEPVTTGAAKKKKPSAAPKKKKKNTRTEKTVMSYVMEGMTYMHPMFSSDTLTDKVCELAHNGPYTRKQLKSAVHGFLYASSKHKLKDNPYPLIRTDKKTLGGLIVYRRVAVKKEE